ncbi:TonB-dependent receptor [Pseudomaricurvus alkylphenolicus]|uniref:TonB-dependent receptor n=1 Tax=Pseudomaricurvus alkylphenolicus TaxID=1306991 RepID=UPI001422874A|nr:TonB-dependent receptor [Pseudomaricurvus alkylphenolicus]NIB43488.1 TonB-dependent receptor [Pseudomaricurvus alkylphenolicus]
MNNATYIKRLLPAVIAINTCMVTQAKDDLGFVLEEVIITAQKREQSLQEVGVAVSAFTGESLENQGITQSNQVGAQVPNLTIATNGGHDGAPVFYIRGVGLNDFSVANSGPVGVYQDEVYIKNLWAQNFTMFDLAQVEVLRGPQGTLFGRNTTAGAMLFHSRMPTEELEGRLRLEAGSFDTYTSDVAIGGALAEGVSGRLALQHLSTEGYLDNKTTDRRSPRTEKWSYRGTLQFDISDTLTARVKYQGGTKQGVSVATKARGMLDPLRGTPCELDRIDHYQCANALGTVNLNDDITEAHNDFEPKLDTEYNALMTRFDWDISDSVTLTAISSFDKTESHLGADSDGASDDILTIMFDDESKQFSQEFRVSGEGQDSNWVVGVYYLNDEIDGLTHASLLGQLAPVVALPEELTGISDASALSVVSATSTFQQETVSYAVFGQYEKDLTDDLHLTLGLRYTKEESDLNNYQTLGDFAGFPVAPGMRVPLSGVPLVIYDDSLEDDNLSGKIGLDYHLTNDIMLYGHVSTAFKAGGFNSAILTDQFQAKPYEPETSTAYELGVKATLWGDRLQLNAASFFYDYNDAQVFTNISSSTGSPARVLTNAPESEMKGFEAELLILPMEGLTVQLGLGYVDSELKDFRTEEVLLGGDLLVTDLSGNTTPVTPQWTYNILVSYEWRLTQGDALFQVDYNWQDDIFFSSENIEPVSQKAYGIVNARLGFVSADEQWQMALWGRNLADQEHRIFVSDLSDFGTFTDDHGAPRSFGVEFTYHL